MPYFTVNEDGEAVEIPVKIKRSPDYKTYYAHGAQGGILGSYHYKIDFYREDMPATTGMIEKAGKQTYDEEVVVREIDCSVFLSLPFAKQLRDWLDRNIKNYEEQNGEIQILSQEIPRETE